MGVNGFMMGVVSAFLDPESLKGGIRIVSSGGLDRAVMGKMAIGSREFNKKSLAKIHSQLEEFIVANPENPTVKELLKRRAKMITVMPASPADPVPAAEGRMDTIGFTGGGQIKVRNPWDVSIPVPATPPAVYLNGAAAPAAIVAKAPVTVKSTLVPAVSPPSITVVPPTAHAHRAQIVQTLAPQEKTAPSPAPVPAVKTVAPPAEPPKLKTPLAPPGAQPKNVNINQKRPEPAPAPAPLPKTRTQPPAAVPKRVPTMTPAPAPIDVRVVAPPATDTKHPPAATKIVTPPPSNKTVIRVKAPEAQMVIQTPTTEADIDALLNDLTLD
jgi:hypothetical protein